MTDEEKLIGNRRKLNHIYTSLKASCVYKFLYQSDNVLYLLHFAIKNIQVKFALKWMKWKTLFQCQMYLAVLANWGHYLHIPNLNITNKNNKNI